jgi:putative ABC transport system substrate-binding protein
MSRHAAILTGWWFVGVIVAVLSFASPSPLAAYEIAILKSSDIAAYNQAVSGLQAELGDTATLTVYDLEGDVTRGKKLARKIRASDAVLVIAVGLKPRWRRRSKLSIPLSSIAWSSIRRSTISEPRI